MIKKIEKTPLKDRVYESIKKHLLSGEYKEGDKIPSENAFSRKLFVSRVVVREALERLREENLIVTRKGKGSFFANPNNFNAELVSTISYAEFVKVMDFRFLIESEAINQATRNCENKDFSILHSHVESMKNSKSLSEFSAADYSFHEEIVKRSKNPLFVRAINNEKDKIMQCFIIMNSLPDSKRWAIPLHEKIVELLVKKDGDGVIKLLKTNGEYNYARMKNLFKE